jgi:hypothetical protein
MSKEQLNGRIAEFEKILGKTTDEEQKAFIQKKIDFFKSELEKLEKPKKPKQVPIDNSVDYDFDKGANKHLVKAKKVKRSILDDFTGLF